MKRKLGLGVLLSVILFGVLLYPSVVKGTDKISNFDNLFSNDKFIINSSLTINDGSSFESFVRRNISSYNITEYWNSTDDYSNLMLEADNCDYDSRTCKFVLSRNKYKGSSFKSENVKTYENIKIEINNDVDNFFPFVKDNNVEINYDESMFSSDTEKNNYINSYFSSLGESDRDYFISYWYNNYDKTLRYEKRKNGFLVASAEKEISKISFNYKETTYSDDFKKLTNGTLNIKSDSDIDENILRTYLREYYHIDSFSFELDGKIANNKAFIKLMSNNKEKEKHLVTLERNANVDSELFNKFSLDIKAPDNSNKRSSYIQNYLNAFNISSSNSNYSKESIFGTDDVIISYVKYSSTNKIEDIQIHKDKVRFVGYQEDYSNEYNEKIGKELVINSDIKNESIIHESLGYNPIISVLGCNDEYTICDIGLIIENKSMEIHSVNIKYDTTFSDEFKKDFNLKSDNTIDIISDADSDTLSINYYYYDDKKSISYSYSCSNNYCNLGYRNYSNGKRENHKVKCNIVVGNKTKYYESRVHSMIDVYPGEETNIWNRLSNYKSFAIGNSKNITSANCKKASSDCDVILKNSDNNIEIHKSKVNIKSGKSLEYKAQFPNEKLELNAIYKNDDQYIQDISSAFLIRKTKNWSSYINDYNDGKAKLVYDGIETHTVDINFAKGNKTHQKIVDKYLDELNNMKINIDSLDLEFINNFYYNDNDLPLSDNYNTKELNARIKKIIKNKHVGYYILIDGGGGDNYLTSMGGRIVLYYDGIAYGITDYNTADASTVNLNIYNILYIPDDTENSKEAYIKAAQKRIDDYLGKNSGVTVSFKKAISKDEVSYMEKYITNFDGNSYYINQGNKESTMLIVKDSSKMQKSSFVANDTTNNIEVSSPNANYPYNTIVSSEIIDFNSKLYKKILEKLKLKYADIIDINLYAKSTGHIKDFDGTNFKVNVPIDISKYKNKDNLYAYYIDDFGNVEEHPITLDDFMAEFDTTHFSTYIISEKIDSNTLKDTADEVGKIINNPNTYDDGIVKYLILGLISLISIIIAGKRLIIKKS